MKTYNNLVDECRKSIEEIFPWDLEAQINSGATPVILDIREPYEFDAMRIQGSVNVPRGILESACEYGYEETIPDLVKARDKEIVVVCRSGYRSVLAAYTMQQLGYTRVKSLKTGLRGWNDNEQPLVDNADNAVEIDAADNYFAPNVKPEQLPPSD